MACGPCAKRRQLRNTITTQTVPVKPAPQNRAVSQGNDMRSKLRFTGR